MEIGASVKIDKCDVCPAIVGKTAKVTGFTSEPGYNAANLNFGRGRPQANRPSFVNVDDISLVIPESEEKTLETDC